MFKKTVTYEDWNGESVTEDFYFNLTRTEILEMEYSLRPGQTFTELVTSLMETKDTGEVLSLIKEIVLASYGRKSADGKRFVKNAEIREEFEQSMAFDEIYIELASDSSMAADFVNGIMPKALQDQLGPDPKKALLDKAEEIKAGVSQ